MVDVINSRKSLYKSPYIKDILKLFAFEELLRKDKFDKFIFKGKVDQKIYFTILRLGKVYNKKN